MLGCIRLDFPAWAKILDTSKNPKEFPVRAQAGGALPVSRGNLEGFPPGDGEIRALAELRCSEWESPGFCVVLGVMAAKGCHTWAWSPAGVRGKTCS